MDTKFVNSIYITFWLPIRVCVYGMKKKSTSKQITTTTKTHNITQLERTKLLSLLWNLSGHIIRCITVRTKKKPNNNSNKFDLTLIYGVRCYYFMCCLLFADFISLFVRRNILYIKPIGKWNFIYIVSRTVMF